MARVSEAVDALDRLIAAADGVAAPDVVDRAAVIAGRVRRRTAYLGESVVVALAGGTGSGKTSLLNALAGEDVAEAGVQRPTTSAPLAWIPRHPEPGLVHLLDELGITERVGHGHERYPWLALIDLPDTDSVVVDHLATVERLLPQVDAVVWVLDPEKYQDRALHEGQLRRLADYRSQFVFVLNQVDRLDDEARAQVLDDLRTTLGQDGIPDAEIVATAADPPLGLRLGLEDLVDALAGFRDARTAVERKLMVDVARAATMLVEDVGRPGGTGFDERWDPVADDAAGLVADGLLGAETIRRLEAEGRQMAHRSVSLVPRRMATPELEIVLEGGTSPAIDRARDGLDTFVRSLAAEAGGIVGEDLRREAADLDDDVRRLARRLADEPRLSLGAPPGWWTVLGWVRRAALLALVMSAVWLVDRIAGDGTLLGPVAVIATAAVVLFAGAIDVGPSGESWARRHLDAAREELRHRARSELERIVGRSLRRILRARAEFVTAHVEFEATMRTERGSPLVSDG